MRRDELTLFATDPRGYKVLCNDAQMEHIYAHHPELKNFWATEEDLAKAISNAPFIFQSVKSKEYNVYYLSKPGKNTELKVVVRFDENNTGILWAAQPSAIEQRKPGERVVWPLLKN